MAGTPLIQEHQPRLDLYALPRVIGTFQGRFDDLKALGTYLTGDIVQGSSLFMEEEARAKQPWPARPSNASPTLGPTASGPPPSNISLVGATWPLI